MDLSGTARERLGQLDEYVLAGAATEAWLARELRNTLIEMSDLEDAVEAERERREDF